MKSLCLNVIRLWGVMGLVIFMIVHSDTQTRRALLIGINTYKSPGLSEKETIQSSSASQIIPTIQLAKQKRRGVFHSLDGCTNDVDAMSEIIRLRYNFKPQNMFILKDTLATRENIIEAFRDHLIHESSAGDQVFFYYAGHGSQVYNSKSQEADKMDESIVPSDYNTGALDIRDKEIRKLFNEALDKGIILTAIFDCCHSASIARGLPVDEKIRMGPPDLNDIADSTDPGPIPSERGALIVSACQDFQTAGELTDEQNIPHGAFTSAMVSVMRTISLNVSAEELFLSVKAKLQEEGRIQEPDLEGSGRKDLPPFGGTTSGSGKIEVAIVSVDEEKALVEIQGGPAAGIYENCELQGLENNGGDQIILIKVIEIKGMNRSVAMLISGNVKNIKVGDLFQIHRWEPPNKAVLRVWISPANIDHASMEKVTGILNDLKNSRTVHLVDDPTIESPTHSISWDGVNWILRDYRNREIVLGPMLKEVKIISSISSSEKAPRLFVNLPPSVELRSGIELGQGTINDGIEIANNPADANYILVGRLLGENIEYSWVLPNMNRNEIDSLNIPLPLRTDWISIAKSTDSDRATNRSPHSQSLHKTSLVNSTTEGSEKLTDFAVRLGKLYSWLNVNPQSNDYFPYKLGFKNVETGETKIQGPFFGGEKYRLVLRASEWDLNKPIEPRYVYVFVIDSWGKRTLLFPSPGAGNLENHFPISGPTGVSRQNEIALGDKAIDIVPPFGIDNFFLLTSAEAIPSPEGINSEGVMTRGESEFLFSFGSATRGVSTSVPINWSVIHMAVKSVKR